MRYFLVASVISFIIPAHTGCSLVGKGNNCDWSAGMWAHPGPKVQKRLEEVQIRVYDDRWIRQRGPQGSGVSVYGVRLQPDGSERVVWRSSVQRPPNEKGMSSMNPVVKIYYKSEDTVYVEFENSLAYEFDRNTGREKQRWSLPHEEFEPSKLNDGKIG